jgi:hypothetical protein
MTDIYLAIAIVSVVSLLLGLGAYLVARRAAKWVSILIAAGAAGLIVLNIALLRHSLWPVRLLPVSNMIQYRSAHRSRNQQDCDLRILMGWA